MKKRVTITIDPALLKQAKIQAVNDDTNFSALIEQLLRQFLAKIETEQCKQARLINNAEAHHAQDSDFYRHSRATLDLRRNS